MSLSWGDALTLPQDTFSGGAFPVSIGDRVFSSKGQNSSFILLPGFVDVHVHLREPGFSYKETIRTGTLAAARGGYTAVCTMPNLNPVPDSAAHLRQQLDIIRRDASIRVLPYGAITVGQQGTELSALEELSPYVVAFSDDGRGVQSDGMMRRAMETAKRLGKLIVAHCEDNSLLHGGYIHDGAYARAHGHRGICSESEWRQIQRDLSLVRETGCSYHVCHISAKESVALLRQAKAEGLDVTCETAPHYLLLDDSQLEEDGRFKMNPPLRGEEDRAALIEGILDGTVDMIATDHAPHHEDEKRCEFHIAASGISGFETAFCISNSMLVKSGRMTLPELIERMSVRPAALLGVEGGRLSVGCAADVVVFDPDKEIVVDASRFLSRGKNTPFDGKRYFGEIELTLVGGKAAYQAE